MPEIHLRQPGFTYSACRTFNKNKEWIQKFKETGDSRYICQNDRVKYLPRRTASDKKLHDQTFNIAKNPKYDRYPCGLLQCFTNFFDKKYSGGGVTNAWS